MKKSLPDLATLAPRELWREFAAICAEVHPSGHEHALRAELFERAHAAGLKAVTDDVGNLRIERRAAPGLENRPLIILQSHLDMVPQANADLAFDFLTTPVTPVIGGRFVTADGTTLGADNGIGLAAALALLFDSELQAGPLALLATVEEETSMRGAFHVAPEMLRGDILLNLDSETEGEFYCGCAGGCRLTLRRPVPTVAAGSEGEAVKISLLGLQGGHSGMDIDKNRGNAIRMLVEFLLSLDDFAIADFRGGSLDNAIPRECFTTGLTVSGARKLQLAADRFAAYQKNRFNLTEDFDLRVEPAERPKRLWSAAVQPEILWALLAIPNGVIERSALPHAVVTSNNLASAIFDGRTLTVRNLPRSFDNSKRDHLVEGIREIWKSFGGRARVSQSYPGWKPAVDSPVVRRAQAIYSELFGPIPPTKVIHAGLECGIFLEKNPKLAMLSFGPTIENPHSPAERVEIDSVEKFYHFLKKLVVEI